MVKTKITDATRKAIYIGSMCSLSYLAVYLARNILGAVSPQMIDEGVFTTEQVGLWLIILHPPFRHTFRAFIMLISIHFSPF